MLVKIYKIQAKDLINVKKVLEVSDMFDAKATCKCGKSFSGRYTPDEIAKYEPREEKGGRSKPAEKKCECGSEFKVEKKVIINAFSRNGYKIRAGDALGKPGATYLYIKGDDDFFKKHEKEITSIGAAEIKGAEKTEIEKKIEDEDESAAAGVGMIFG